MEKAGKCNWCNKTENSLNTLSCSHQFCSKCMHKLFLFNYNTLLLNFKEELSLKCLHCQDGELKTTRSFIHKVCSETNPLEPDSKSICQNHNKEEDVFCKECRVPMCQDCFVQHKLIRAFSFHQSVEYPYHFINIICSKHNKTLDYQCITSNIPICEVCKSIEHKDHNIEFIKDYYEKKMDAIKKIQLPFKTAEECVSYIDKEEQIINDKINKNCITLIDKIQMQIESLIQTKEDVLNNAKQLEKESKINFKITRNIYEALYWEIEKVNSEDYLNINLLLKLPAVNIVPKIEDQINEASINRLKEIMEMINKLNAEEKSHLKLNFVPKQNTDSLKPVINEAPVNRGIFNFTNIKKLY